VKFVGRTANAVTQIHAEKSSLFKFSLTRKIEKQRARMKPLQGREGRHFNIGLLRSASNRKLPLRSIRPKGLISLGESHLLSAPLRRPQLKS
jgi:hypothetical protein